MRIHMLLVPYNSILPIAPNLFFLHINTRPQISEDMLATAHDFCHPGFKTLNPFGGMMTALGCNVFFPAFLAFN